MMYAHNTRIVWEAGRGRLDGQILMAEQWKQWHLNLEERF